MNKAEELMREVQKAFYEQIDYEELKRHDYLNDDYRNSLRRFKLAVESLGLQYGKCYHANGIGNNNEYPILLVEIDEDGFRIEKQVCKFYYCVGIYGGVSAYLYDNNDHTIASLGRAS